MFTRSELSYEIREGVVEGILKDDAHPLNRIAELIPEHACVLDIGAGNGLLPRIIMRKKRDVVIDGIEPCQRAAEIAKPYYRSFLVGRAENHLKAIGQGRYSHVVMADVIEHLADPLQFMQMISRTAPRGTKFILSVPNVAFGAIRISLLRGEFRYVDSGLLERTHLRFFTLSSLRQLVDDVPLFIERTVFLCRHLWSTEIPLRRRDCLCLLGMWENRLLTLTYQFVLVVSGEPTETSTEIFGVRNAGLWGEFVGIVSGRR